MPQQEVAQRAQDIWAEFLAEGAPSSINLDSHSYERTSHNLRDPGRYSYEDAQVGTHRSMRCLWALGQFMMTWKRIPTGQLKVVWLNLNLVVLMNNKEWTEILTECWKRSDRANSIYFNLRHSECSLMKKHLYFWSSPVISCASGLPTYVLPPTWGQRVLLHSSSGWFYLPSDWYLCGSSVPFRGSVPTFCLPHLSSLHASPASTNGFILWSDFWRITPHREKYGDEGALRVV